MNKRKNDIERYLRGEMTPSEMHALENEALRDPFLSDALEGVDHTTPENFLFDLQEIRSSIHQRIKPRKPKIISMWNWSIGIAASLLLLAVSSIYIISSINDQEQQNSLALKLEQAVPQKGPDEVSDEKEKVAEEQAGAAEASQATAVAEPKNKAKQPLTPANPPQNPAHQALMEPVVQEQAAERTLERIVEADLTEAPVEIERNPAVDAATGTKPAGTLETAQKEIVPKPNRLLQGKVTSTEDGSALPGVNVLVKGTSIGTVTDAEGNYQIPVSDPTQTLLFGYIGMKSEEVTPGNKSEVDVQLSPDFSQLSEIVVTGYGDDASGEDRPALEFAEPAGGRQAFQQYLEEKMHYPEQAIENKVEGRVTVQFTVGTNGQLEDFKVLKGLGYGCDDEVIRLIKEGPAWSPSKRNAQPVPEKVKVRLKFDIPEKH